MAESYTARNNDVIGNQIEQSSTTGNPIIRKVNDVIRSVLSSSMEAIVEALGVRDGIHYHGKILEAVKKSGLFKFAATHEVPYDQLLDPDCLRRRKRTW